MTPPIKNWSFSALKDFEACPYRIYLARVEQSPRPEYDDDPNHPLTRGTRLHTEAEMFIRGTGPLTPGIKKCKELLLKLREEYANGHVICEERWAFDREWGECEWKDRWVGLILDVVDTSPGPLIVNMTDWKSGKSFGKDVAHTQQMQLYAIGVFLKYPEVNAVNTKLGYLDEGKIRERQYLRTALPMLLKGWEARGERMTSAIHFPAKANRMNCRYCDFGTENGTGACPFAAQPNK